MPNTCGTCVYFSEAGIGECHRYPPTVVQGSHIRMLWSVVSANDWCGEYETAASEAITITSITPASLPVGSTPATVSINGAGFDNSCTIYADGSPRTTFFVSSTELQYTARPDLQTSPSTVQVTVENSAGGVSNALPFSFT